MSCFFRGVSFVFYAAGSCCFNCFISHLWFSWFRVGKKNSGDAGYRTSRMLSERSTIWATSPSHCSNTPSEKFNRTLTSPKSRSFLYYSLEAWARPNQSSRIRSQISQQNAETSTATIRVSNFHYFSSFDFYRMFVFLLIVQSPKQFFRRTLRGQCKPLHPRPPYFLHGF